MQLLQKVTLGVFFLALGNLARAQEKAPGELFREAYAFYSQENYGLAEPLLVKTLDRDFRLEDYSLYFLGEIALLRDDQDGAHKFFRALTEKFPASVWVLPATLELAKARIAAQDYAGASERLRQTIERAGRQESGQEARFLLARLHELQGELTESQALYQQLREMSPLSPWAAKARKEANRMREAHPQQLGLTTWEALAKEADLLHRERQFEEAGKLYRKVLGRLPRDGPRARFLKRLGQVYLDSRRRDEAIPVLSEIVRDHGDAPEAPEALYHLARIYWNRDENLKALEYFKRLQERYPENSFNDAALFASARIQASLNKPEEARRLYESFGKKFPNSPLLDEVTWSLAWLLYLNADYSEAHDVFKRLAQNARRSGYKFAALYWQGRLVERMGRSEEAKQIYSGIVGDPEDSYYKGPAAERLKQMGAPHNEQSPQANDPNPSWDLPLSQAGAFHLARARALEELGLNDLAVRELDAISDLNLSNPDWKLLLMHEYARNKAYARSMAIANEFPDSAEELRRYRYPLGYWESIQRIAGTSGLDPYLVVALIRQESLFDPKAVSPASAYGLMQLLPSTAARVAKRLSLDAFTAERLFEPELNLRLGARHLKEMLQQFPKSLPKAIAAYNAGEQAVARWEKQIEARDEEEFIELIPYGETRLYVKLVLRNHRIYTRLYDSQRWGEKPAGLDR